MSIGVALVGFATRSDQFLRAQERALQSVNLDCDVSNMAQHLLFARQRLAVNSLRATERESDKPFGASQQITLGGEQSLPALKERSCSRVPVARSQR